MNSLIRFGLFALILAVAVPKALAGGYQSPASCVDKNKKFALRNTKLGITSIQLVEDVSDKNYHTRSVIFHTANKQNLKMDCGGDPRVFASKEKPGWKIQTYEPSEKRWSGRLQNILVNVGGGSLIPAVTITNTEEVPLRTKIIIARSGLVKVFDESHPGRILDIDCSGGPISMQFEDHAHTDPVFTPRTQKIEGDPPFCKQTNFNLDMGNGDVEPWAASAQPKNEMTIRYGDPGQR